MFCKTEKLMLALHAGRQPLVGIYRTILDLQHFYVGHFNFFVVFFSLASAWKSVICVHFDYIFNACRGSESLPPRNLVRKTSKAAFNCEAFSCRSI